MKEYYNNVIRNCSELLLFLEHQICVEVDYNKIPECSLITTLEGHSNIEDDERRAGRQKKWVDEEEEEKNALEYCNSPLS